GGIIARSHATPDPDRKRVDLLRSIRVAHPRSRIVAFSQYARTITALGRLLRADSGVVTIHGDAAHIAFGPVSRAEILAQFGLDGESVPRCERIDLLLTTDLLSEGVDLRAASVIVHL